MRTFAAAALMLALVLPAQVQAQAQARAQVKARTLPDPQTQTQAEVQLPLALERFARARDNLIALRDGRRAVRDLSPQELQDVLDYDRQVRGGYGDARSVRQRCIDSEVRREGGNPSRLAWEVIRLKCRD